MDLASNYVVAGGDCFVSLLGNFIDKFGGAEFFNDDKIAKFLSHSVNRYLYSYGTGLSYKTKKMSPKHNEKITREVGKITSRPFMKDTNLYIDSGGFQVAMGAVVPKDMPDFITKYHEFLDMNHDKFKYAFSLDLPPGPSSSVFDSYEHIEQLNDLSYSTTANLPTHIRDKMLYIHHFRTPSLHKTWGKFLWEKKYAEGFKNFATGGIVANMATDLTIPVIIYTIPLSEIVKYAKTTNLTSFNFHVLGGANFIDVFYHKLFSYHIKKVHGLDVKITYDSSALFKGLAIGRFIPAFDPNGTLFKMSIRSKNMNLRFFEDKLVCDQIYYLLNNIARDYGFKELNEADHPVYDPERNTLTRSVHMYLICYMLWLYKELERIADEFIEKTYPLYESGNQEAFDEQCYGLAQRFNQGKNTRKQKAKIASLCKSLKILTDLDVDYNQYLINKFMSSDELSTNQDSVIKF